MSKLKHFLLDVEDKFFDLIEENCVLDYALDQIEYSFGKMARQHCESIIQEGEI